MPRFRLSEQAEEDVIDIAEYGTLQFGKPQAQKYGAGLYAQFQQIAAMPEMYRNVDHIHPGMRRCVYGSHAIYFIPEADSVLIVRILGQQDVAKALKTPDKT